LKLTECLGVDSLIEIDVKNNEKLSQRDSQLLMKQMAQMAGFTRFVCFLLLILSTVYLFTRVSSYKAMNEPMGKGD
jgi:hypothetical protein